MRCVCIQASNTTNLVAEETYYLFPHGGEAYYVSRFPRQGSHLGAYQKLNFAIVDEEAVENNEIT